MKYRVFLNLDTLLWQDYFTYTVMFCAIWYHLYNLENVKNTDGGVLLLVKFRLLACNVTKSNTLPWVFFTFFKLYKWHQIAQRMYMVLPR